MNEKSITLTLSEADFERMRQVAEDANLPLETMLLESFDLIFGQPQMDEDVETEIETLPTYTDEQLWAVINRRLPRNQSIRWLELTDEGRQRALSNLEQEELNDILETIDSQMLLRSHALNLLQDRGHDIKRYLKIS